MSFIRAFALMFVFCVDVQVKAEAVYAGAIKTVTGPAYTLVLDQGSLLDKRADGTLQLVDGAFYAEVSGPVRLSTPYAKVWCQSECKALFSRRLEGINIKSLSGQWHLSRTGDRQEYQILAGTQVIVGEVVPSGAAAMELPQSLPWTPTIHEWARLYPGKFAAFKAELKSFHSAWARAVDASSDAQVSNIHRLLAAVAEADAEARHKRQAAAAEDAALRKLFREKNP